MLNPYFLNGSQNEQNLVQSLVNEQLKMYGVEVYYLPRQYATEKTIIKEVIESKFEHAYPLEAYVDSYEGFGGQGTILSKFGIQEKDDLTLVISKERFSDYISPFMEEISDIKGATHRPREGDLIWFPLGEKLFEIKYVEHEQPFYQLEKNYIYQLRCELYRYEDEVIDTGIEDVDDELQEISTGYTQILTLIGAAVTATGAATTCASGSVNTMTITNMGKGYSLAPLIGFSSAPAGGTTAVGIASITTDFVGCSGSKDGKVHRIYITNSGCGYTVAPWVSFETIKGQTGSGAAATTGITTLGSIQTVSVINGGSGYISNPNVTIGQTDVVGVQTAFGIGIINSAGSVVSVAMTFGGVGFATTSTAVVTIDPPATATGGDGSGNFVFNEVVTGGTSGTEARVKGWNSTTNVLEVSIVTGDFLPGERIVGSDSEASYSIRVVNEDDTVDTFADNDNIESEADAIIDFTSNNPFGMP